MYCGNCGAELSSQTNFCPYCGAALRSATTSISLLNKAASTAQASNQYNLVLIGKGSCDATMAGDLLEDVFGYTDAESATLVTMAPVVVGENLTAEEAATVAQLYTEYGLEVSVTDSQDQYVDLSSKANSSVFDSNGNLLTGIAAIIGALTVANRISSYRRYKKPTLLERLFRLSYTPKPPVYRRNFRPHLNPRPMPPRRTIKRPPTPPKITPPRSAPAPSRSAPSRSAAPKSASPRSAAPRGAAQARAQANRAPAQPKSAPPKSAPQPKSPPSGGSSGRGPSGHSGSSRGGGPKR